MSDDPTADFLAREKAILGDDADLFASGNVPSAPSGMDSFPDLTATTSRGSQAERTPSPAKPSGMDAFPALDDDLLGGGGGSSDVRVTGHSGLGEDPELEKFESAFPDISSDVPTTATKDLEPQPYGTSPYPPTAAPQARPASSILPTPQFTNTLPETEDDTEPIIEWRERQAKEIEERNAAAKAKREEMANKAEKAIDQFYEDYNKEKEKNIRENKENEKEFVEKLKDDLAKGTAWERVTDIIGLENSQSKTIRPVVGGGADLTRMKEILLTLRREGDKAPGAAGF